MPEAPPRLAVVTTHPVQYYAPLFRELAERGEVDVHVFYGWRGATEKTVDHGFGSAFAWDIPLLEGYRFTFVENTSSDPGTHHMAGIDAPDMVATVEAWSPDAILVLGWNYRAHWQVLRGFSGRVPILFRGDSTLLDESDGVVGHLRTIGRRIALRWVYRHVDHAVYVGTHNQAYFEAHGIRGEQLSWAPHAVDNVRFAGSEAEGRSGPELEALAYEWRQALGIEEGERVAVFVGKLEAKKAPDVLLGAFERLSAGAAHLVFCGTGPLEEDLRARAIDQPDVHFVGFQNQSRMPIAYRLGDVVVLPSRGPGETWGLAVNEAMASGRAVIVSDRVGCAPDLVTPSNGRIVPADDAEALAEALRQVLAPGVAEEMGAASREIIERWSIEEAAFGIEQAVHRALGNGGTVSATAKMLS